MSDGLRLGVLGTGNIARQFIAGARDRSVKLVPRFRHAAGRGRRRRVFLAHDHEFFLAADGDRLRALLPSGAEELGEFRFRGLNLPNGHTNRLV